MSERQLSEDEWALLKHTAMFGSDGYPIRKRGRGWHWEDWRSVRGPPTVYKTKRAAVEAFSRFLDVLIDASGAEAKRRYEQRNASA